MNTTNRIILNTVILYAKMVIVMIINLWTVPLLLRALGQSDYGVYQLVAGVITMLTFINASMTLSTQRYMSVVMGQNDSGKQLNTIYNVSLLLHLIIGIGIVVVLEILTPFLFNGFLNIESERIGAARWIYQFLIISTFFSIISVPFDAELNAYENMTIFALISIIDAILRLAIALSLPFLEGDLLIMYGAGMAIIATLNALLKYIYTRTHYKTMFININSLDKQTFKEMFGFAGWNTFSAFSMTGRNQGVAIILNLFMGTVVNAAYGIANQINSLLVYFSATLQKSFNPQLMKSEGMNDNDRMLKFSFSLSKMSVLAILILALPLIIEMPYVLMLWLGNNIPDNTIEFARYILILSFVYQLSAGLMSAIQARGIIRTYTLTMSAILLANLPLAYLILWLKLPVYYVIVSMIIIEVICLIARLFFAHALCNLSISSFIREIIAPTCFIFCITTGLLVAITYILPTSFARLVISYSIGTLSMALLAYILVLSTEERQYLNQLLSSIFPIFKR